MGFVADDAKWPMSIRPTPGRTFDQTEAASSSCGAMCRLLGVLASEPTDFRFSLKDAPRSLANLSREHPHGWGIATYSDDAGWSIRKRPECALEDAVFDEAACSSRGEVLLAHVRQKTVGPMTLANTHPFQQGRWMFAHNGTIEDIAYLESQISPQRRAEVVGDTDSELFFAYLLTRLDAANLTEMRAGPLTDAAIARAMRDALKRASFGACNFLLSNGETLYAHRCGRSLFVLRRTPRDRLLPEREVEEGVSLETHWSPNRHAVFLASEALSDEPWEELPEGSLVRVDRRPAVSFQSLGNTLTGLAA